MLRLSLLCTLTAIEYDIPVGPFLEKRFGVWSLKVEIGHQIDDVIFDVKVDPLQIPSPVDVHGTC